MADPARDIARAGAPVSIAGVSGIGQGVPAASAPSVEKGDPAERPGADVREIGDEAMWTLSTAKPGNGVEQLRDGNVDTFWQSDGPQPHLINIQFHKKQRITDVAIYTDYKLDESYTPAKISVRAGSGFHDLVEVQQVTLEEPSGWVDIKLPATPGQEDTHDDVLRAYMVQIAVLASHQNGRDTHIRQTRIYGPRSPPTTGLGTELTQFTSLAFSQFATIR